MDYYNIMSKVYEDYENGFITEAQKNKAVKAVDNSEAEKAAKKAKAKATRKKVIKLIGIIAGLSMVTVALIKVIQKIKANVKSSKPVTPNKTKSGPNSSESRPITRNKTNSGPKLIEDKPVSRNEIKPEEKREEPKKSRHKLNYRRDRIQYGEIDKKSMLNQLDKYVNIAEDLDNKVKTLKSKSLKLGLDTDSAGAWEKHGLDSAEYIKAHDTEKIYDSLYDITYNLHNKCFDLWLKIKYHTDEMNLSIPELNTIKNKLDSLQKAYKQIGEIPDSINLESYQDDLIDKIYEDYEYGIITESQRDACLFKLFI